jgi:hypothetical protein
LVVLNSQKNGEYNNDLQNTMLQIVKEYSVELFSPPGDTRPVLYLIR